MLKFLAGAATISRRFFHGIGCGGGGRGHFAEKNAVIISPTPRRPILRHRSQQLPGGSRCPSAGASLVRLAAAVTLPLSATRSAPGPSQPCPNFSQPDSLGILAFPPWKRSTCSRAHLPPRRIQRLGGVLPSPRRPQQLLPRQTRIFGTPRQGLGALRGILSFGLRSVGGGGEWVQPL